MGDCGFCAYVPRERVMAVCEWALAKVGEMRREKDRAFLREQARRRNCWRRLVRMRPLSGDEVHRRLMQETDSLGFSRHNYPWRCWRERVQGVADPRPRRVRRRPRERKGLARHVAVVRGQRLARQGAPAA